MKLTDEEKYILGVIRFNKSLSEKKIYKKVNVGRLEIYFHWRSKKNLWGRFGGGWNWKLGFQAGGRTIIFYFLIFSLGINLREE